MSLETKALKASGLSPAKASTKLRVTPSKITLATLFVAPAPGPAFAFEGPECGTDDTTYRIAPRRSKNASFSNSITTPGSLAPLSPPRVPEVWAA